MSLIIQCYKNYMPVHFVAPVAAAETACLQLNDPYSLFDDR